MKSSDLLSLPIFEISWTANASGITLGKARGNPCVILYPATSRRCPLVVANARAVYIP